MSEELLIERDGPVAVLTLNRPEKRNALTFGMYEGLAKFCREAGEDESLRCVVITGAGGKAFAAGTDISLFRHFDGAKDGLKYEKKVDGILADIEACPVPTIAAIAGACTGGGAAIAAVCDIRIATSDMAFGFPIARTLGNCLSIASLQRLNGLLGPGRTKELLLTARLIAAEEAERIGLVSELHGDFEALTARARELAHRIAGFAPVTLGVTKQMYRRMDAVRPVIDDEDLIALSYGSEDFREGLEAFLTKRKAEWKGR